MGWTRTKDRRQWEKTIRCDETIMDVAFFGPSFHNLASDFVSEGSQKRSYQYVAGVVKAVQDIVQACHTDTQTIIKSHVSKSIIQILNFEIQKILNSHFIIERLVNKRNILNGMSDVPLMYGELSRR